MIEKIVEITNKNSKILNNAAFTPINSLSNF
jgi:hypothetical protein